MEIPSVELKNPETAYEKGFSLYQSNPDDAAKYFHSFKLDAMNHVRLFAFGQKGKWLSDKFYISLNLRPKEAEFVAWLIELMNRSHVFAHCVPVMPTEEKK